MRGQIETISVNHTSDEYPPDGGSQKRRDGSPTAIAWVFWMLPAGF